MQHDTAQQRAGRPAQSLALVRQRRAPQSEVARRQAAVLPGLRYRHLAVQDESQFIALGVGIPDQRGRAQGVDRRKRHRGQPDRPQVQGAGVGQEVGGVAAPDPYGGDGTAYQVAPQVETLFGRHTGRAQDGISHETSSSRFKMRGARSGPRPGGTSSVVRVDRGRAAPMDNCEEPLRQ